MREPVRAVFFITGHVSRVASFLHVVPPLAFVALMLSDAAAADGIRIVEARSVAAAEPPGAPGATHGFRLHLHLLQGTRWRPENVISAALQITPLFAQCERLRVRGEMNGLLARQAK